MNLSHSLNFFLILFCTFYKTNQVKKARFMLRLFFFQFSLSYKKIFYYYKTPEVAIIGLLKKLNLQIAYDDQYFHEIITSVW